MRVDVRPGRWWDVAVVVLYLAAALLIIGPLWRHPAGLNPAANSSDPPFFEWALIHATRIFTQGENPFATQRLNAPLGVNLMANTGVLGLSVPLVPVTLLFGPSVSFALVTTLALAGTASAWYFVLSRYLTGSPVPAAVGGAFAGFAPGLVNHANGHPNLVAQFLIPFIVWRALALSNAGWSRPRGRYRLREPEPVPREPEHWVRRGVVLGLLVTWQALINEELLFLAALAAGVFVAVYAAFRPAEVRAATRPFLRGAAVAAGVAGVLLAYPLWYQFAGPGHYHGLPAFVLGYGADLASYPAFAKLSLVGQSAPDANLAPNPEENTFFGWPLLLLLVVAAGWLWRRVEVRALAVVAVVFFVLSLGATVNYRGHEVLRPAPWGWLNRLPLFDSVVPVRLGLVLIPVFAILLAFAVDEVLSQPRSLSERRPVSARQPRSLSERRPVSARQRGFAVRLGGVLVIAAALVPVVPHPLPIAPRPPVPEFISGGDWRRFLTGDRSLLSADTTWYGYIEAMVWDNAARQGYRMVGGYFLGPDEQGRGSYGPRQRPTASLLAGVGYNGGVPVIGDQQRAEARADVRFWNAELVVLADDAPHPDDLRATLTELFGPGQRVDDVWLWSGMPRAG